MTHSEVIQKFLKWALSGAYSGWFIFQNNSGYASEEKVHYGVPNSGGGFDLFGFGPGGVTEFFEVKTNGYPTLSKKQKVFRDNMTRQGFKCWVVREHHDGSYIVDANDYRPYKNWPYDS